MLRAAVLRVLLALGLCALVTAVGGVLIWWMAGGEYAFFDSLFFAVISVTTVGYGELPEMQNHPSIRVVAAGLIILGVGTIAFFQSSLTTLFIEGYIGREYRSRRMKKRIESLQDHVVIAGCGRAGRYIVEELVAVRRQFVVIDSDEAKLLKLVEELGNHVLFVVGDATDDHTLVAAGIERAVGIVAALSDDRDNLFITVSSRSLNPKVRIVSKVVEVENEKKILRAGADSTVIPHRIGGLRLVSELIRPRVTEFLDNMLRVTRQLRFEEVEVGATCTYVNKTLREVPIRAETNLLVVALHEGDDYVYNPGPDQELRAGVKIIVMGEMDGVQKLRAMFA
jgi:voltage-gated potassium channel